MALLALFTSILLPSLQRMRANVQALVCASNMKSVAVEFSLFAESAVSTRGNSDALGPKRFWINDFQERLYRIDEFWDEPNSDTTILQGRGELMLCPATKGPLIRRRGLPCSSAALGPANNVSMAMNMRLYRAEIEFQGDMHLAPANSTQVLSRVVHHPYVPLLLDVNGEQSLTNGVEPFYTAPPLDGLASQDDGRPYSSGQYWMPSSRHDGRTNVAFVGGHVLSSTNPATERWDWAYQATWGD